MHFKLNDYKCKTKIYSDTTNRSVFQQTGLFFLSWEEK